MTYTLRMPEAPALKGGGRTRGEKRINGSWPGVDREYSVLKIAGTYANHLEPTTALIDSATEVYLGGHINEVTAAQKTTLEAAGYTVDSDEVEA